MSDDLTDDSPLVWVPRRVVGRRIVHEAVEVGGATYPTWRSRCGRALGMDVLDDEGPVTCKGCVKVITATAPDDDVVIDEDDMCEGHPNAVGDLMDCGLPVGHGAVPEDPTPVALGPRYEQLTIPGAPSRPRRAGSTPRPHCTRCGRFAAHAHRDTDTGSCVVHGACHLTWD